MLEERENHVSVGISNKLFMIGGSSKGCSKNFRFFEVFDSVNRKFTSIKSKPKWIEYLKPNRIVYVGYNIYFFVGEENNEVKVYSFDVNNYIIKHKTSLNLENTKGFICTKVSME